MIKLREDKDIITKYSTDKCPKELKEKFDKFWRCHNKIQQAICDYKNKFCNEENSVIKFQNSSYYSLNRNSFSSISSISDHSLLDYYSFESFDSFKNGNEVIYIKRYFQDANAIFLFLSDGTSQTLFKDKIKVIISEKKRNNRIFW